MVQTCSELELLKAGRFSDIFFQYNKSECRLRNSKDENEFSRKEEKFTLHLCHPLERHSLMIEHVTVSRS